MVGIHTAIEGILSTEIQMSNTREEVQTPQWKILDDLTELTQISSEILHSAVATSILHTT